MNLVTIGVIVVVAVAMMMWVPMSHAQDKNHQWPVSVDEAVKILKEQKLTANDQKMFLSLPKDTVSAMLHHGFGTALRNEFGLWAGNDKLMKSCGKEHPDDCSGVIIEKLWESIRRDADPARVASLDCQFETVERIKIDFKGFYKLRIGDVINSIETQIDAELPQLKEASGCQARLSIRISGDPDLSCWTRAEFSEDGSGPIPLSQLLGWISWRNGFSYQHDPPYLNFAFYNKCAWPQPPKHFQPETSEATGGIQ